jgi:hypothetical protein
LLDWTENPLAALWFSLADYLPDKGALLTQLAEPRPGPDSQGDCPVVWIMEASSLNRASFGPEETFIYHTGGDFTKPYLPDYVARRRRPVRFKYEGKHYRNARPIAIYPARRTARVIAQQGVFTVHGVDHAPLDTPSGKGRRGVALQLARILIDRSRLACIMQDLEHVGVNRYSLFPDLDSLSKHLEWTYWPGPD